ncbi:MAG: gas vesicle protein GvpO [Pseudomonadota bacterium]
MSGVPGAAAGSTSAKATTAELSNPGDGVAEWQADAAAPLHFADALALARRTVEEVTGLPIDGIADSGADQSGGWRIVVEVIESPARIGENDLLAAHEVRLSADGAVTGFARRSRYRREEGLGG